ncbi:MAG: hypothetical protein D3923_06810 [Candidatus Electrothrix sp. AR3]|nr:hypothetical protein [Candidatus Electrothrix sp. AR3]
MTFHFFMKNKKFASRTLGGLLSLLGVVIFVVGSIGTIFVLTLAHLGESNFVDFWYALLIVAGLLMIQIGNRLQGWNLFRKKT